MVRVISDANKEEINFSLLEEALEYVSGNYLDYTIINK